MVNTGQPSRACQGCKAIKTKCEGGKPSCKRCTRMGKACVYADADPMFRSMNKWTEKTVKVRVGNRLAAREAEETQCMEKYLPSFSKLVAMEWSSHAIGPFFDRFINQPDRYGSTWGFLPWLPKTYGDSSVPRFVADATKACALANLANASKIPDLEVLAGRSYGRALRGLHSAMSKPTTSTSNDTLSTMMLLALYEIITGSQPPKEMFQAHLQGQAAAMRMRAKQRTLSEVDSSISSHTNRFLMWRDLACRVRPTYALSDWPPGMYRSWLEELSSRFTLEVVELCGRVREVQEVAAAYGKKDFKEELSSCIGIAIDLERSFEQSVTSAPVDWLPITGAQVPRSALQDGYPAHLMANKECPILNWKIGKQINIGKQYNLPSTGHEEPYLPRIDVYPSHPVALLWNYMRCARLHLLRVMIDLHMLQDEGPNSGSTKLPTLGTICNKLSDNIHDICALFPYLIGDFYAGVAGVSPGANLYASGSSPCADAAITMWVLHKVLAVPGVSPAIKRWAIGVFERLGTIGNIRQGLNLRNLYSQERPMLSAMIS